MGVPKKSEQENNKRGRVSVGGGNTERKRWKKHGGEVGARTIGLLLPAHFARAWCVRRLRWIANERPWKTSRCRLVRGCLNWRHSPLNPMEWVCRVAKTILAPCESVRLNWLCWYLSGIFWDGRIEGLKSTRHSPLNRFGT